MRSSLWAAAAQVSTPQGQGGSCSLSHCSILVVFCLGLQLWCRCPVIPWAGGLLVSEPLKDVEVLSLNCSFASFFILCTGGFLLSEPLQDMKVTRPCCLRTDLMIPTYVKLPEPAYDMQVTSPDCGSIRSGTWGHVIRPIRLVPDPLKDVKVPASGCKIEGSSIPSIPPASCGETATRSMPEVASSCVLY